MVPRQPNASSSPKEHPACKRNTSLAVPSMPCEELDAHDYAMERPST
jgi:hypothetical protein